MSLITLFQRAELFQRVVGAAGLFREPMSLADFRAVVSPVVREYAELVDGRKANLDSVFMVKLPVALKVLLRDRLKLSEDELLPIFRARALAFHQALIEARVYLPAVDEATFLDIANPHIHRTMKEALAEDQGILDLTYLHLASSIVAELRDNVLYYSWDFEFGYEHYFERLGRVLKQVNIPLEWAQVVDGPVKRLEFQIGDRTWVTDVSRTGFGHIMSEEFYSQLHEIHAHLKLLGWQQIDLPGVDQVAESLLVPLEHAHVLDDWLLAKPTELLRIFYGVTYWPR